MNGCLWLHCGCFWLHYGCLWLHYFCSRKHCHFSGFTCWELLAWTGRGPGLPIGHKLNKAFMTQVVSVAPQRKKGTYHSRAYFLQQRSLNREKLFCACFSSIHFEGTSSFSVPVLLIFKNRVLLFWWAHILVSHYSITLYVLNKTLHCTYLHSKDSWSSPGICFSYI